MAHRRASRLDLAQIERYGRFIGPVRDLPEPVSKLTERVREQVQAAQQLVNDLTAPKLVRVGKRCG